MYFFTPAFQKMYICILFATFSLYQSHNLKMNQNVKLCINCKNYQRIKKIPEEFGICKLFSPDINLITGKSLYYPALVARKLDKLEGNIIEYLITADGPEPIQKIKHKIDYDHYIEKQIKPIANQVLILFGKDFDAIFQKGKQSKLF